MPRGPKGEKRPADVIGAAIMVGKIATGEIEEALSHYWKFDAESFGSLKSRRGDGFVPCLHRRGPEGSVRSG